MKQLIQPNLNVKGSIDYCLAYAQTIFGVKPFYPNAWTAWMNTKYKHLDQNFPKDAAILQWYSYILNGENLGHVTVNIPGKGIYSSPWQIETSYAVLPLVSEVERIYGVKYVGWSEDIEGVRVAQPAIINDMPTPAEVNLAFAAVLNRQATDAEKKLYSTRSWDNFLQTLYNNSATQRTKAANYDKLQASYNALKAQTGDTSDATLLGKVLIPILNKLGYKKS